MSSAEFLSLFEFFQFCILEVSFFRSCESFVIESVLIRERQENININHYSTQFDSTAVRLRILFYDKTGFYYDFLLFDW